MNRFTKDIDLLIDLEPDNAMRAMSVFGGMGLQPRTPVALKDFADADRPEDWFQNRNMLVFQLWHPQEPLCTVDVFIRNPIAFDDLWRRSERVDLGGVVCRIVGIEDLIRMKSDAGRPQDLRDIEELRRILRLRQEDAT